MQDGENQLSEQEVTLNGGTINGELEQEKPEEVVADEETPATGGLISEFFHFGSNLQKEVPDHNPEHYLPKKEMVKIVIWHHLLEVRVKKFLRLSLLYRNTCFGGNTCCRQHSRGGTCDRKAFR